MPAKDTTISVRVDSKLKDHVQKDLDAMGLDFSTLFTMTLKAVERSHSLPFAPTAISPLDEAIAEVKAGNFEPTVTLDQHLAEVRKLAKG
ncbi:type II toxin-antitoxin system RelB/DinJ family antitoxin [Lacticaseibacillus yichunensis]|uniref:Type II toxin-antitoxin system RelB/DinJ family antitoxin n=1 Tax=Lacticaseibacillus yichunensis TaxID=2486015 RepID=A0ABW4CQJ5_9LACO|nr:type II toxin-antitoxin system RelB/DinJ family antitoxin [Lacticaseibacillus yichunensis]